MAAPSQEVQAEKRDASFAAEAMKCLEGRAPMLVGSQPGKQYKGTIIALRDTVAILKVSKSYGVLLDITNHPQRNALELGKEYTFATGPDNSVQSIKDKAQEKAERQQEKAQKKKGGLER